MPDRPRSSELERIARLRAIYADPSSGIALHAGIELGIGDDAAVVDGCVLSVDASIEDTHFRRAWIGRGATFEDVGYRATIAALSDLAAMGAEPRAILSSLTLPPDLAEDELDAIARGIARAARAHAAPVIGGNLARAAQLGITTTVVGRASQRALRRDGAAPGDAIWVTGTLGAAAIGLATLERSALHDGIDRDPFVRRFLAPFARVDEVRSVAALVRAAIDVSDGLARDLGHLCAASGAGARIELDALPREPGHDAAARAVGLDPFAALLAGGVDYEVLVAAPDDARLGSIATRIGVITAAPGIEVVDGRGTRVPLPAGHDHFAR